MLTVTSQQSRFYNEAIEGSALKEVGSGPELDKRKGSDVS